MKTTVTGTRKVVPATGTLDAWTAHEWRNGTVIDALGTHDRLIVRTRNSTYEIIVTAPHTAEVLIRGGSFFPEFTSAHIGGSSLGGSFLKLHGVYAGFQLEIITNSHPVVVTTRICTVTVVRAAGGEIM